MMVGCEGGVGIAIFAKHVSIRMVEWTRKAALILN